MSRVEIRAEGEDVVVGFLFPLGDYRRYLAALQRLHAAKEARDAGWAVAASREEMGPLLAAYEEAAAHVSQLYAGTTSIDEAERLYGNLGGSIIQAKAYRGDFNRGDSE